MASTVGYLAGLEHSLHRMSICGESSISFATRIFVNPRNARVRRLDERERSTRRASGEVPRPLPFITITAKHQHDSLSPRAVVSITIIVTVFTSILAAITILTTILVTILIPTLVNIIINNVTFFFIVVVTLIALDASALGGAHLAAALCTAHTPQSPHTGTAAARRTARS